MSFAPSSQIPSHSKRNLAIAGGVVLLHVVALWGLQSGLLRRAVEVVVPVAILTELVTPPASKIEPPPPAPRPPEPVRQPVVKQRPPPAPPAPQPIAVPNLPPAPSAPVGIVEPQPPAPPIAAPVGIAPAPPAPPPAPAPARVELPSSNADYLQNPKPVYPPISKRMGEQGKVVVRVLIGPDGNAQDAQLKGSSGFDRLDRAAVEAVRKWRYVPGKRNGVPEAMWFDVPINFVLEQS